ncbi:MAG: hypothetical protein M3Y57_17150 [Acidobacteriota bacterium]|nr:hypothetical protein [Acidobacteriota bacterium]
MVPPLLPYSEWAFVCAKAALTNRLMETIHSILGIMAYTAVRYSAARDLKPVGRYSRQPEYRRSVHADQ